ncbi:MAG: NACHT domain-containing protein, partial [Chloroflexi bacterium]|nr:NACHT domain-containing protein [Chloroflexota bacterium]
MSSTNSEPSFKAGALFDRLTRKLSPDRRLRNQYLENLSYQHRNFDVKGLTTRGTFTLELEQIFVDLSLGPQTSRRASTDPIRPMPKRVGKERYDLWEYLTAKQMKGRNLVILGPPGSGKTTLLKHLTLALAARKAAPEPAKRLNKLPVLLFLRDHAETINRDPDYSLNNAVESRLTSWDSEFPTNWLASRLQKGECLVMLDGLDEVADPVLRQRVVEWVDRQMALYGGNRFLVTSRPFGYHNNPLQKVTVLEVRPFTIEQVQIFVHNWYLANEIMSAQRDDPGVRMDAHKGAEDLLWRLRRTHVLLEMAVNPLLLTMIATVHRYRSSLPGRRVELYSEIAEVFLGKRQQARGITYELTPAQKQRVLETLAFYMMRRRKREIPVAETVKAIEKSVRRVMGAAAEQPGAVEEFLKMIENSSGLLVEREAGLYGFAHLTFQEYLAAVHVRDQKQEPELLRHVEDGWWHETIRLYAAQADATNIVKACLTRKKPSVVALTLAMECLEEAREVRPELRTIFDKLAQSVDHERPDVRNLAAEVLLTLRLRRMVRVDEGKYIDSSFVTHAEYQIFLDEESAYANYYLPDHWKEARFPTGLGRTPVVGVRPSDALTFCDWLTRRNAGDGWRYRLPNANERESIARQSKARDDEDVQLGYWYADGQQYRCARFEFSDSALTQSMTRQLEQRIAYDWALEHRADAAMKQASDYITSRARQRRFMLFDFERERAPAARQGPGLSQDLKRARDRVSASQARHLDRVLSDAVARADSLDVTQAHEIDMDSIVDLIEALRQDLEQADDVENSHEIGRQIAHNFEYALNLARKRNVIMNPELVRALSNTRRHARNVGDLLEKAVIRARARVRSQMLDQVVGLIRQADEEKGDGRSQ